ncbi:mitochondrial S-adenosylmethionine carrier protein-like isoform X2 [Gordionus sp. m RMFG-2023]|uniref:mitochondrial S-adenosylmethionine carrier protein-like isoform X2 n=1 Tax=Gordionus sp. m RMFG-2023 TaxID=3053472 RepID=UPI0031FC8321
MEKHYLISLMSGAIAGTAVDTILFPLDTIKTRLQSNAGFFKSGGFKKIYSGIGAAFVGSAPTAAIFFITYEFCKRNLIYHNYIVLNYMMSAAVAESVSCIIRVPIEVIKQRRQAFFSLSNDKIIRDILLKEGLLGFYRGLLPTILREIPFSFVQYPLWEYFKKSQKFKITSEYNFVDAYTKGALAGGVAAALTTPLDVIKTKIILAKVKYLFYMYKRILFYNQKDNSQISIIKICKDINLNKGFKGYFAGLIPRIMWISIGGAIFLGTYEITSKNFEKYFKNY